MRNKLRMRSHRGGPFRGKLCYQNVLSKQSVRRIAQWLRKIILIKKQKGCVELSPMISFRVIFSENEHAFGEKSPENPSGFVFSNIPYLSEAGLWQGSFSTSQQKSRCGKWRSQDLQGYFFLKKKAGKPGAGHQHCQVKQNDGKDGK